MHSIPDDELIGAYLDDELSAEERSRAERLLVERPELRRLLEELRALREGMQSLPAYALGDEFRSEVLRHAELAASAKRPPDKAELRPVAAQASPAGGEQSEPVDFQRWRRPLFYAVTAVAAALAVMLVEQQRPPRPENRNVAVNLPADKQAAKKRDAQIGAPKEGDRLAEEGLAEAGRDIDDRRAADKDAAGGVGGAADAGAALERHMADAAKGGFAPQAEGTASPAAPVAKAAGNQPSPALAADAVVGNMNEKPQEASNVVEQIAIDEQRGRQLIDNLRTLQLENGEREGVVQFQQVLARNNDELARQLPGGQFGAEGPLVVTLTCNGERGAIDAIVPALQRQNIVDYSGYAGLQDLAAANNAAQQAAPAPGESLAEPRREPADANQTAGKVGGSASSSAVTQRPQQLDGASRGEATEEVYFYLVAKKAQVEEILNDLKTRTDAVLELQVEPPPGNPSGERLRNAYNRSSMGAAQVAGRGPSSTPATSAPSPAIAPAPKAAVAVGGAAPAGSVGAMQAPAGSPTSQSIVSSPTFPMSRVQRFDYGTSRGTYGPAPQAGVTAQIAPDSDQARKLLQSNAGGSAPSNDAPAQMATTPIAPAAVGQSSPAVQNFPAQSAMQAQAPSQAAAYNGMLANTAMPPDYQEALFVVRIVNDGNQSVAGDDAAPAAAAKPGDAAGPSAAKTAVDKTSPPPAATPVDPANPASPPVKKGG